MLALIAVAVLGADGRWTGGSEAFDGGVRCEYAFGAERRWLVMKGSTACLDPVEVTTDDERHRDWLHAEVTRLEGTRPSRGWFGAIGLLSGVSSLAFLVGLGLDSVDRCGLFQGSCRPFDLIHTASTNPGTIALWVGGVTGAISSIFFGTLVARLQALVDDKAEALRRELDIPP